MMRRVSKQRMKGLLISLCQMHHAISAPYRAMDPTQLMTETCMHSKGPYAVETFCYGGSMQSQNHSCTYH